MSRPMVVRRWRDHWRLVSLKLKPDAKQLGKPEKTVTAQLKLVATDTAGNRTTTTTHTITVTPDKKPKRR